MALVQELKVMGLLLETRRNGEKRGAAVSMKSFVVRLVLRRKVVHVYIGEDRHAGPLPWVEDC